MASRKSPSQRDPLSRLSQAVRAGSPASMGGRVANATSVTPAGTGTHRTVTPASASGLAIVSTTAPSSPPTGQLWYDPSATC